MDGLTEFFELDPEELHLVGAGANGFSPLLAKAQESLEWAAFAKACQDNPPRDEWALKFVSAADRRKMAASGVAMPNGDFPIPDEGHLHSAIGHLGGYTGDRAAAKRHIIKRARALGLTHLLPGDWNVSKENEETVETEGTEKALPGDNRSSVTEAGSEGQTSENHPNTGPKHIDNAAPGIPNESVREPAYGDADGDGFQDGHGDHASGALPVSESESQTSANTRKEGDPEFISEVNPDAGVAADPSPSSAGSETTKEGMIHLDITETEFAELRDAVKQLVERDNKRRARKQERKEAREAEEAAAKTEGVETAPAVEAAVESVGATEDATKSVADVVTEAVSSAVKSAVEPVLAELEVAKGRIAELEAQPMPGGPVVTPAGVESGALVPVTRGQEQPGNAFKALEEEYAAATDPYQKARLGRELTTAKIVAAERSRAHR